MIGLSYEQIIEKIRTESGLSQEEIEKKIKTKVQQLSDLISKEGAAHIVANELGIKLFQAQKKRFKIKELVTLARNVEIVAKVIKNYEIRAYKVKEKEGRVASILLGDETGIIKAVFWDENIIKQIERGDLKEDTILKIKNAYVKENNGYKELHLGSGATIEINPEGEAVEISTKNKFVEPKKKEIKDLKENDHAVIYGTVVQLFEPRFYEACPMCGKKLEATEQGHICKTHNKVEPVQVPIINLFFDDGTDNIKVVCFREQAEKILGINTPQIIQLKNDAEKFQQLKNGILLKQLKITGRANKNQLFGSLEFVAQNIETAEPQQISEELSR